MKLNICVCFPRSVSPSSRLSVSPIRPVKSPLTTRKQMAMGADVPPPWKQGGFVGESSYTMTAGATRVQTSASSVHMEQNWEGSYGVQQQVSGQVREVRKVKR